MYGFDLSTLEDHSDAVKAAVLKALVRDGLLSEEQADTWASSHTVLHRHKNIFRTVSNIWEKNIESNGYYVIIAHAPGAYMTWEDERE